MIEPDGAAHDARDLVTEQDPAASRGRATSEAPGPVAPRRRRRWPVFVVAVVVVLGLAGGLLAWAPWTPPPVLRPTGLVAGPATANTIALRWSRPPTGPLPDKYLILGSGQVSGSVAGTITSFQLAGLTPGTTYQYRVVAVRGGTRSPQSALLTVRTLTPPISQARLQGSWQVIAKNIGPAAGGTNGGMTWQLTPRCAAGPCGAVLRVTDGTFSFKMRLARAGAVYKGRAVANGERCGSGSSSIPDPATVTIKVRITRAVGEVQAWAATSLTGTMVGTYQDVSSASIACSASTFKASLAGSQS